MVLRQVANAFTGSKGSLLIVDLQIRYFSIILYLQISSSIRIINWLTPIFPNNLFMSTNDIRLHAKFQLWWVQVCSLVCEFRINFNQVKLIIVVTNKYWRIEPMFQVIYNATCRSRDPGSLILVPMIKWGLRSSHPRLICLARGPPVVYQ